jgi:hypothetical protein
VVWDAPREIRAGLLSSNHSQRKANNTPAPPNEEKQGEVLPPPKLSDEELIASILKNNPKLTREEAVKHLEDIGAL